MREDPWLGETMAVPGIRQTMVQELFKHADFCCFQEDEKAVQGLLGSKFAEVAYALHARAAQYEMLELAAEFKGLVDKASAETPNIGRLRNYLP